MKNVLNILKEASAERLLYLLRSIDGKKDLVLDKEIICSLDYIANFTLLKACGVEKVFKLESGPSPGHNEKCVYLIRSRIQNVRIISDHINANISTGSEKQYWVIYVSRKFFTSEKVFEREGIYGSIRQLEFPLGFVSLDRDLISLEIIDFYKAFFLKGDLTYIHTAATSLVQLCKICGPIPKIYGQGRCAKMVVDSMSLMMQEAEFSNTYSERVSHLIILDRDIDYTSVLLSQLTYEGVLDETFGINSGRIIFPKEVTGKEEPMKVVLNSSDVVYDEIRNVFFASMFGSLQEKAKELKAKSETSAMSIGAMKDFVTKEVRNIRQQHASLSLHIGACEVIMKKKTEENFQERLQKERDIIEIVAVKDCLNYIEDVINRQDPFVSALRLMCLLSIAQNGLSSSDYKSLATQFRQSYGSKYLITLRNLKKVGLLVQQPPLLSGKSGKVEKSASVMASKIAEKVVTAVAFPRYSSFKTITRKFNLITSDEDSTDLKNPQNMNYVFGGAYVPLFGRITEQVIVNDSFKSLEDGMKLLPGSTIVNCKTDKYPVPKSTKVVIVYILGGVTYAEVAALRLLPKLYDCKVVIATTSLISGNSLIRMLSPT